jgi:uncharacterized membrane-anchored protein YhcB (DUF1043 family)
LGIVLTYFLTTRSWFIPVLVGAHIVLLLVVARLLEARIRSAKLMKFQLDELRGRLDRQAKRRSNDGRRM